jgi:hypothetical protein
LNGLVPAAVVHQNDFIHNSLLENLVHGLRNGFRRVVGGHDHDDFPAEIHLLEMLPDATARVK